MRYIVLALATGSAFAVAAIQTASAADIPARIVKAPAVVAPVFGWTGFYIGGSGGGGWADTDWRYANINAYSSPTPGGPPNTFGAGFDGSGWIGGGQAGYNHQINQWVLGVEVSGYAAGLKDTVVNGPVFGPAVTQLVTTKVTSIFTATGRVGFLVAPPWLLYAKGGYAGGTVKTSGSTSPAFPGFVLDWNTSEWHNGWTVGVGTEYRVTNNITVGVAYDYIDLTGKQHVGPVSGGFITAANQVVHDVKTNVQMLTARVNFLFGR